MKPSTRATLAYLRRRGSEGSTSAEARTAIAIDRLAARVNELRAEGYVIESVPERAPNGAVFCRYFLVERRAFAPVLGVQESLL